MIIDLAFFMQLLFCLCILEKLPTTLAISANKAAFLLCQAYSKLQKYIKVLTDNLVAVNKERLHQFCYDISGHS